MVGFFFLELRFTNASWPVSQGEGVRMVMDLQDVNATLKHQVAQSNIRFFSASSQILTADDPQDNEEDTIPVSIMKVSVLRITTTLTTTLMTVTLKTDRR